MDSGVLSAVLNNKRKLPKKDGIRICGLLKLDPREKENFLASLDAHHANSKKAESWQLKDFSLIEESAATEKIISEWEYFAFLSLMDTKNFKNDPSWISRRLAIGRDRVTQVIENLALVGLISQDDQGNLTKPRKNLTTTHGVASQVIRQSHKEGLVKALDKIETVPLEQRSYSSMTLAFNPENIEKARELIREFRRKFSELFDQGAETEVYHLAVQFFPLTELQSELSPKPEAKKKPESEVK